MKGKQQPKKNQQKRKPSAISSNNQRLERAPVSKSRRLQEYHPVESRKTNGSRCIKFKEYVQDIPGSILFSTTAFQCNPGLSNLFAWLSGQAIFYQEYKVKSLRFRFETEKATTLSGKIMFAFLQDSADAAPASKQEMLENLMKASGAIWEPFTLPINMSNFPALGKSRFIRGGDLAPNLDVKTYDIGQLIVATQGMADTTLVGELYIEYEVELLTPIQNISSIFGNYAKRVVAQTTITPANPFGTTPVTSGGLLLTLDAASNVTFGQTGQFIVNIDLTGVGLNTAFVPTITPTGLISQFAGESISNAAANAGTQATSSFIVTVTARGQSFLLVLTGQATSVASLEMRVSPYPYILG